MEIPLQTLEVAAIIVTVKKKKEILHATPDLNHLLDLAKRVDMWIYKYQEEFDIRVGDYSNPDIELFGSLGSHRIVAKGYTPVLLLMARILSDAGARVNDAFYKKARTWPLGKLTFRAKGNVGPAITFLAEVLKTAENLEELPIKPPSVLIRDFEIRDFVRHIYLYV